MSSWYIYRGTGEPHNDIEKLPAPPKWRRFNEDLADDQLLPDVREIDPEHDRKLGAWSRGTTFQADEKEIEMVNAALFLRRPLLVTGKPGSGKSSLAYAIAHELRLGKVLVWPITSRSTLQNALYQYDAIGRLQESQMTETQPDIGQFIRLGPLGTAFLPRKLPRVLLIDEIDKCDFDLPNDLLHVFEEGSFNIPELKRLADKEQHIQVFPHDGQEQVSVKDGTITCKAFPIVVMTSNAERELPPAFLRRCVRLDIDEPNREKLGKIVRAHFSGNAEVDLVAQDEMIEKFLKHREHKLLATDQLLNAIYLALNGIDFEKIDGKDELIEEVFRSLSAIDNLL